jgi:MYXO-CTERM domain-containing protein
VTSDQGELTFHPEQRRLPGMVALILRDAGANQSSLVRDQVQVNITSQSGDQENVLLTEIQPDKGVFAGSVWAEHATVALADGVLQATANDRLEASYQDADDGTGSSAVAEAEAEISCDLDRDGYDDHACGGSDCNDFLADFGPGATEFCDGQNEDCDEQEDESCASCGVPDEPDITPDVRAPTPLACGECYEGDFDEAHYGDDGHYRVWGDAYEIEAEAGQTVALSIYRPEPDGILAQALYDDEDDLVATDNGYGSFIHTFERSGTHTLTLVLNRVDHTVAANDYRLEYHCLPEVVPEPDAGPGPGNPDAGVDSGTNPGDPEDTPGAGCGCRTGGNDGAAPVLLLAFLAVMLRGRTRRRPRPRPWASW